MTNNPFSDAFKSWGEFNGPSVDYKDALASTRKNAEVFISAGQVVAEGAQAIARKQAEIARNATQEAIDLWKEVSSSKNGEASAAKQADYAKNSLEQGLNNSRELLDMASKISSEAYELLSEQAQQAANEVTKASKKSAA